MTIDYVNLMTWYTDLVFYKKNVQFFIFQLLFLLDT